MTTLTPQQKQLLLQKGISEEQIKKYETKSFGSSVTKQKKDGYSGFGSSIVNFGKDLGQSLFLATGGQKKVDSVIQKYVDAGDKLFNVAQKEADPEKRKQLLIQSQNMYNQVQGVGEGIIGKIRSNKQIVGDALGTLGFATAGGSLGVAKKAVTGVGFIKGAVQGAKTGAKIGGIYGGLGGVQSGLSEDKSASEIARRGITGTISGGATGGILGGAIGGVSGGIAKRKLNVSTKKEAFAKQLVMPKETAKTKAQALAEGRVTEQGLLKGSKITPSKRDNRTYEAVKDIVSSKKSVTQNIDTIRSRVKGINSGVEAYISKNKIPRNTNQIKSYLNKGKDELKLIFASDKQAEKTYNAIVEEFMKNIQSKDTLGFFKARQKLDSIPAIKKLLNSQGLGENAKREIVLTVREMANRYIADLLPSGNIYRSTLLKESNMIKAITNIAESNTKIIGKSKLIQLVEDYPVLKWVIGGAFGAAGVGVGGAIVGSTD